MGLRQGPAGGGEVYAQKQDKRANAFMFEDKLCERKRDACIRVGKMDAPNPEP